MIQVQVKTALSGLFGAVGSDTGAYGSARRHSELVQTMIIIISSGSLAFTFGTRHIEHAANNRIQRMVASHSCQWQFVASTRLAPTADPHR